MGGIREVDSVVNNKSFCLSFSGRHAEKEIIRLLNETAHWINEEAKERSVTGIYGKEFEHPQIKGRLYLGNGNSQRVTCMGCP